MCSLIANDLNAEGAQHVAEALKINTTLTDLKYAATCLDPYCLSSR